MTPLPLSLLFAGIFLGWLCRDSRRDSQKRGSLNHMSLCLLRGDEEAAGISPAGEHPKQARWAARGTCSQQSCLQSWLCCGLGTAWVGSPAWGSWGHLRRIRRDYPGDFPNTIHSKKEQLFPSNKRGPPFTSAQALLPEGMGRYGGGLLLEGMRAALPNALAQLQMHQACISAFVQHE